MDEKMYTTEEAAELLRVSAKTVRNYIRQGHFPTAAFVGRTYLIKKSEIDAFIAAREGQRAPQTPPPPPARRKED